MIAGWRWVTRLKSSQDYRYYKKPGWYRTHGSDTMFAYYYRPPDDQLPPMRVTLGGVSHKWREDNGDYRAWMDVGGMPGVYRGPCLADAMDAVEEGFVLMGQGRWDELHTIFEGVR